MESLPCLGSINMLLVQARKISELESYGWVFNEPKEDCQKLLNGLPVTMRNLRRDLATVYPDGSMRPVEYQPTLCRMEDYGSSGGVKASADASAMNHVRNMVFRAFGWMMRI